TTTGWPDHPATSSFAASSADVRPACTSGQSEAAPLNRIGRLAATTASQPALRGKGPSRVSTVRAAMAPAVISADRCGELALLARHEPRHRAERRGGEDRGLEQSGGVEPCERGTVERCDLLRGHRHVAVEIDPGILAELHLQADRLDQPEFLEQGGQRPG